MKTIQRRTPFFGLPEDAVLIGCMGDGSTPDQPTETIQVRLETHGNPHIAGGGAVELGEVGTDIALGFIPHDGENRTQRLAGVANFVPPTKDDPSRRELLKQRQKRRRGKLDPELRRLQRERLKQR